MPNLDQNSTKMLNLTVLQRIDPFIEEILITAAHVTFYEFNVESNQWVRLITFLIFFFYFSFCFIINLFLFVVSRVVKTLKGLFLWWRGIFNFFNLFLLLVLCVSDFWLKFDLLIRNAQPRFQFIVMNRRNTGLFVNFVCVLIRKL